MSNRGIQYEVAGVVSQTTSQILYALLVINWRQKSSARSQLRLAIEDVLDTGLPRVYDKPLYEQKCVALFEHVYESYPERDTSLYALAS